MFRPTLVVVSGSRSVGIEWDHIICDQLDRNLKRIECDYFFLMHGACPHPRYSVSDGWRYSVDMLADEWANARGVPVMPFAALWESPLKEGAGPMRNRLMVDTAKGLMSAGWKISIHAFHPDLDHSAGTGGFVKLANAKGFVVNYHDGERIHQR